MNQALYPKERYPRGHPRLVASLSNVGNLLQAQGAYGEARGYFDRSLAIAQALYPKDQHPTGHPFLARSLNNLGAILQAQGEYGEAQEYYERALRWSRPSTRRSSIHRDTQTWPPLWIT